MGMTGNGVGIYTERARGSDGGRGAHRQHSDAEWKKRS